MDIIFDNIIFSLQRTGGISVYWSEIINHLKTRNCIQYIGYENDLYNLHYNHVNWEGENVSHDFRLPLSILRFLPYLKKVRRKSIFHSSYQRVATSKNAINIVTIHDFGYELEIMRTGLKRKIHIFFKRRAIRKAHGIICISHNTKQDLIKFYPFVDHSKITVIYNGVSSAFKQESHDPIEEKYILFVGNRDDYKNFKFSVGVVQKLKEYKLVIAGGKSVKKNELGYLNNNIPNRYTIKTNVSEAELANLYSHAHCLLYPSQYEGFGIPILEAMRCLCPVVALKNSSIPEVADSYALLLEEANQDSCIEAIKQLENSNFRKKMIEGAYQNSLKFSWEKTADQTLKFYQKIYRTVN